MMRHRGDISNLLEDNNPPTRLSLAEYVAKAFRRQSLAAMPTADSKTAYTFNNHNLGHGN